MSLFVTYFMNAPGEALGPGCNAQMNTLVDQDDCDKTLWESESESSKTTT